MAVAQSPAAHAQDAGDHKDATMTRTLQRGALADEAQPVIRPHMNGPIAETVATEGTVFVGAVTISGLRAMAPGDFADLLTERIGQSSSMAQLTSLTDAITGRMHSRGYAFGAAWIERQRISNGIVVVHVEEGRIDEIRFDGPDIPAVRRALEPLLTGAPVRVSDVERRLLIAGDIDGVRIEGSRYLRDGERGVLLVTVAEDRAAARVSLSNTGTRPIGPEQVRFEVNLDGLLASDDSLTMSYATTPAQPKELQFGYVRYEKRVGAAGTELALMGTLSSSHPGAYLAPLNIHNRSWYVGGSILQPLLRRRKASVWLEGEFGVHEVAQWRGGVQARADRLAVGRVTLYGYGNLAGGRMRVSGTLSQGFDVFAATRPGDVMASRWDADATFTTGSLWADWTRDLGDGFGVRLAAQGQLASQPLLIGEEIGLGGTGFLRGYDWGERSGDEGVMSSIELRYHWNRPLGLAKRAQLYGFVDGGSVSNKAGGFGGGALASTGGGVRVNMTSKLDASFEVGVPLSDIRYDTGDAGPKISFGLSRAF
jgi:hemolysin activation/secretion protein